MSQAPYMPIYTDALIGDTTHLTMNEFGAYCMILFVTWRNNGQPLPDDDRRMARICRMSMDKWMKLRPALVEFFDLSEGSWRQKRLDKEWNKCMEFRAKQVENGKLGGRPGKSQVRKTEPGTPQCQLTSEASNPLENNDTDKPRGSVWGNPNESLTILSKEKNDKSFLAPGAVAAPAKGRKAKAPKEPKVDGYTASETASFERVLSAYPERVGGQKPNMAKGFCRKIVRAGEATWEELALTAAMYKKEEDKNGNVGTKFIDQIQNFFIDNGKYQHYLGKAKQNFDRLRPLHIEALEEFKKTGAWPPVFGGLPRTPGCRVPSMLIDEILGPPPVASRPTLTVVNA